MAPPLQCHRVGGAKLPAGQIGRQKITGRWDEPRLMLASVLPLYLGHILLQFIKQCRTAVMSPLVLTMKTIIKKYWRADKSGNVQSVLKLELCCCFISLDRFSSHLSHTHTCSSVCFYLPLWCFDLCLSVIVSSELWILEKSNFQGLNLQTWRLTPWPLASPLPLCGWYSLESDLNKGWILLSFWGRPEKIRDDRCLLIVMIIRFSVPWRFLGRDDATVPRTAKKLSGFHRLSRSWTCQISAKYWSEISWEISNNQIKTEIQVILWGRRAWAGEGGQQRWTGQLPVRVSVSVFSITLMNEPLSAFLTFHDPTTAPELWPELFIGGASIRQLFHDAVQGQRSSPQDHTLQYH